MSLLRAENITVSFENVRIIEDISLSVAEGETVSLLGVSGAGKTTLFNVLSGLYAPDEGKIYFDGEDITGKAGKISYMLQKDLLLPHKKVIDNAALPLVIRGMAKKEAREKAESHLREFGLEGTGNKYPHQLSGGMRQRVAFLRTYLASEKAALLDEPFSALDSITKSAIHRWFLSVMKEIKLSVLFVTHDIDEAILLSDRVFLLTGKPGKITEEIIIDLPGEKSERNPMSREFIAYKEEIIRKIGII
ncbi:MAG: ABC transporter ATP-binding protein [Clostridia bacterium]|nr:ABC transporter ATP-binding protein [Clostridia bacterium]